ncbi:MAG: excinuclease ABC subunit UvrA [Caldilineae bacterium]|nr:excinuclease ABC subunit UvrA [Chloroflexota bacterium]MCB9175626.1 excinuclease ABC subunit UvrA [Caldilineae bacterium]
MAQDQIVVRGAREHNLKNIDVSIPRDKLVVITGLSGSGKSSLAFDTIYAEGQRRYVESLSAYARQFLGQMEKPDLDQIDGLSPAISIDQKGGSHNPRSTVGTVTEIYDYLRLLYARVGVPHCPNCGQVIARQTGDQIVDAILDLPDGSRILLLAPLVRDRKGNHERVLGDIRKAGFVRARIDGELRDLVDEIELDRYKNHTVEAVIDRLIVRHGDQGLDRTRLTDSVETALKLGAGLLGVSVLGGEATADQELLFSEHFACPDCGLSLPEIEPRSFSFNSPHGACPECQGLGTQQQVDPDLVIPNPDLSIRDGAIAPWSKSKNEHGYYLQMLDGVATTFGFELDVAWSELDARARDVILNGTGREKIEIRYRTRGGSQRSYETRFEGVLANLERRYQSTDSDYVRGEIEKFMATRPCGACGGSRLRPEMVAVTVCGRSIVDVVTMPIHALSDWVADLEDGAGRRGGLSQRDITIAREILKEVGARSGFLVDVGLDYLSLDRRAATLSGGEAQRIRLATQIGSQLMGVLYILDEPSIGLHQRDNARLVRTLLGLRDVGNTVIVVEHDEETMRSADWILDLGPGAGEHGGYVVAEGTVADIEAHPESLTGAFLSGRRVVHVPGHRRKGSGHSLKVHGASANNLKAIDVEIPLGTLTVVTGVSGSGKSSLVLDVVYNRLAQLVNGARVPAGKHAGIEGWESIDKVIDIDQSPIGRTPRSNPATYANLFTPIRQLFSALPEAKLRGYKPGRFSFNVRGGRCEACAGDGILKIEMQFLPDIYVPCEVCHGTRYNRETLEIRYKGRNIAEVLDMSVSEALEFFDALPSIRRKLETLDAVGLGYVRLGQPAPTLSGGEAQRVKLSRELSRIATGNTLYILDEPTTGLHFADVERLLAVLQALVNAGNTVLVIEHNLDIIKSADHLIDLGPEGGDRGGSLIVTGTPEVVAACPSSHTGTYLARVLTSKWVPEPIRIGPSPV